MKGHQWQIYDKTGYVFYGLRHDAASVRKKLKTAHIDPLLQRVILGPFQDDATANEAVDECLISLGMKARSMLVIETTNDIHNFDLDILGTYDIIVKLQCEEVMNLLLSIPDRNIASLQIYSHIFLEEYLCKRSPKVPFTVILDGFPKQISLHKLTSIEIIGHNDPIDRLFPWMYVLKTISSFDHMLVESWDKFRLALQETTTLCSIEFWDHNRTFPREIENDPDIRRVHHQHRDRIELNIDLSVRKEILRQRAVLIMAIAKPKDVAREIAKQIKA